MNRFIKFLFISCFLLILNFTALSQDPPPPPPHGSGGGAIGGGAPIGDGTLVLILLATGYLLFRLRKYKLEEKNESANPQ